MAMNSVSNNYQSLFVLKTSAEQQGQSASKNTAFLNIQGDSADNQNKPAERKVNLESGIAKVSIPTELLVQEKTQSIAQPTLAGSVVAVANEVAPEPEPMTWAQAWRKGWDALVDASKQMREIAAKAANPDISAAERAELSTKFRAVADGVIAYGKDLFDAVKDQLDPGQVRNWQHAFSDRNLGIQGKGAVLESQRDAEVALKQLDRTVSRFERYNKWMQNYHQARGW